MADQIITYSNIFAANYSVTGIRQYDAAQVLMTGTCPHNSTTPKPTRAMLYLGSMNPTDSSLCKCRIPPFRDNLQKPPYSSVFYGPNTGPFNPSTRLNDVRAVGTYNYLDEPEILNHGMLYQGPADVSLDSQFWTTIDVPDSVADPTGKKKVINTLPHSTMGDLIVGNYQVTDAAEGEFNAFVYNMKAQGERYHKLKLQLTPTKDARLVTAYGIWQNDGGASIPPYTIAGGLYDDTKSLNVAYLVDYDPSNPDATLTPTTFTDGGPITHFEGITQCGDNGYGYSLAAMGDESDAAFAQVVRNSDGSFPDNAVWVPVQATSKGITTGNTVLTNNLFGIYEPCSASDGPNCFFRSYAAVISGANCDS